MEIGQKLAQYQINARIGAGGMGEVYKARDTNLDRDVAVKVLPGRVADDSSHMVRLEREAKAIAALSHPNILAVYDFGRDSDTAYVVTELLEGETLRERLNRGALAPLKATEFGRQIARGLAAAHDKGIVHRDLKPENLFVTDSGQVKILDFGLATASDNPAGPHTQTIVDPKSHTHVTEPGTVLGTVDYMSPEQARGEATDNRSDLFAFGSVLYEMITGSRPFHRETKAETMTAILKEEPPELSSLATRVPPELAAIIRRCLEKHPGERFHSAHDLAFSLEALSGSSVSSGTTAAIKGVALKPRRPGLAMTITLVLVGLVIGVGATWFLRTIPPPESVHTFINLSSRRGTVTNARFTGDGDDVAIYSASWAGGPLRLYPAAQGSRSSESLNIGDADLLSVSSTGELALSLNRRHPLGWEAIGTLAVAQPGGAAPRPILENVMVADWSPDGRELAVAHEVDGVVRLEYPIGTVLYESPGWISDIRVHPDGEKVLIADGPARGDNRAYARIVHRDGRIESLGLGGSWGLLWAPDGETVWFSTGPNVYRVRPGEETVRVAGLPSTIRLFDVAASGRLLAATASIRREMIVRPPGTETERDLSWQDWTTPSIISDDGRLVVYEEGNDYSDGGYAVYLRKTDGSPPLQLGYGSALALSPDGAWLALLRQPFTESSNLILVPTGAGNSRPVDLHGLRVPPSEGDWVVDDDDSGTLVFQARMGDGPMRLFRLPLDGTSAPQPITPADFPLAPNGHCISDDGQRVIARPASGPAAEFSIDGHGPRPVPGLLATDLPLRFNLDGRYIFVQAALTVPSPLVRIDITTGKRTPWCELSPRDQAGVFTVDRVRISADGTSYTYSIRRYISRLALVDGLF